MNKKQNFLTGAAILSLSTIIVKIIGMFYKIPLNAIIGEQGFAYFTAAYDIYSVLLVISTTGLPVAMSRMVSEAHTLGNGKQMQRIFRTALIAYMSIGLLGTGAMMLFPGALANMMEMPKASYSIFALGPAVFFICFASAGRGFFQGQGDMRPTAFSQIIEAAGKLFLGLSFAYLVMKWTGSEAYSSGATITGISIGAGLSALYVLIVRRRNWKEVDSLGGKAASYSATAKRLFAIAVPITIGAAGLQLINLLDSMTVVKRLLHAAEGDGVIMNRLMDIARLNPSSDQSLAQDAAEIGKGIYSLCQTIFNFPTAFIPCITAAIIPAITANLTKKDYMGVKEVQNSSLRVMGLIAAPCAVGMLVLAEPIMALLGRYEGERLGIAALLLAFLAPTIVVNSITTMTTAIMQAHNHMVIPVINTLIGGLLKVGVNYILVGNPNIGIVGAPIGTFACFLVIMTLNLIAMRRVLEEPPKILPCLWRSLAAALIMGAVTFFTYRGLMALMSSFALCCLGSIAVAVVVYLLLVILLKPVTYGDCLLLPKGDKIAKILKIKG
ncbi:MAG: polysaccharide biosynthesis protein [Oscillospiraceae bacterium]|nr:polysaccharide biosynthesis protein [Oscillospiraceae bacterium]